jgi:hypothetical protein
VGGVECKVCRGVLSNSMYSSKILVDGETFLPAEYISILYYSSESTFSYLQHLHFLRIEVLLDVIRRV